MDAEVEFNHTPQLAMKRLVIIVLAVGALLIPVIIFSSKDLRQASPEERTSKDVSSHSTDSNTPVPDHQPAPQKSRPDLTDQLPPGSELVETGNGGYMITLPGVGVYRARGLAVAERGLVFKGPIAFAASKEGPWVGYAPQDVSMHMAKDGTTKLSGKSALSRENTTDPSGSPPSPAEDER